MEAKAPAKHAAKVKVQPVHRAMALRHHAAMAHKALPALKARAMVAVKAVAMVDAVKNNVAIPVLTTVAMAKAAPHHGVHVPRAVVLREVAKAARAVKTAVARMATSCHATSTP